MSVYYTPQKIGDNENGIYITADSYDPNKYLNVYMGSTIEEVPNSGNPSNYPSYYIGDDLIEGGTNGTLVSINSSEKKPITTILDPYVASNTVWKLALRCEPGYKTVGRTILWFPDWDDMPEFYPAYQFWGIGESRNYLSGYPYYINSEITDVNHIFYIKVITWGTEQMGSYTAMNLAVRATVVPTNV